MSVTIPQRRWRDEPAPVAPRPVVLVSSRDEHPAPHVAGAGRLAAVAERAGWTVLQQYALADVPAGWPSPRSKAHRLASVAVRFARPGAFGWAGWHRINDGGWRFASAWLDTDGVLKRLGARALTAEVSKS